MDKGYYNDAMDVVRIPQAKSQSTIKMDKGYYRLVDAMNAANKI